GGRDRALWFFRAECRAGRETTGGRPRAPVPRSIYRRGPPPRTVRLSTSRGARRSCAPFFLAMTTPDHPTADRRRLEYLCALFESAESGVQCMLAAFACRLAMRSLDPCTARR